MPTIFATKVPKGKSLNRGVSVTARVYRNNVAGKENNNAAVA